MSEVYMIEFKKNLRNSSIYPKFHETRSSYVSPSIKDSSSQFEKTFPNHSFHNMYKQYTNMKVNYDGHYTNWRLWCQSSSGQLSPDSYCALIEAFSLSPQMEACCLKRRPEMWLLSGASYTTFCYLSISKRCNNKYLHLENN